MGIGETARAVRSTQPRVVVETASKNLNLMTEEFSKAFGKTLGVAAAGSIGSGAVVTAFGILRSALLGIEEWLMRHLPF